MSKRVWSIISIFVGLVLGTILGTWVASLLGLTQAQEAHVSDQVVFRVDHRDSIGRYVMEPVEVRIAYTIEPIEESHPAPMENNYRTVCRQYNEGPKLYLRCGGDHYAVKNIGLVPKNQKKDEKK